MSGRNVRTFLCPAGLLTSGCGDSFLTANRVLFPLILSISDLSLPVVASLCVAYSLLLLSLYVNTCCRLSICVNAKSDTGLLTSIAAFGQTAGEIVFEKSAILLIFVFSIGKYSSLSQEVQRFALLFLID